MTEHMDDAAPPLFSDWLARHARGTLNDEATAGLAEAVQAVTDHRKKATLVITVMIEPAGSGGRTVAVGGRVAVKTPAPDRHPPSRRPRSTRSSAGGTARAGAKGTAGTGR